MSAEKVSYVRVEVAGHDFAIVPWNELPAITSSPITDALLANGKTICLSRLDMTQEEYDSLEEFKGYNE